MARVAVSRGEWRAGDDGWRRGPVAGTDTIFDPNHLGRGRIILFFSEHRHRYRM